MGNNLKKRIDDLEKINPDLVAGDARSPESSDLTTPRSETIDSVRKDTATEDVIPDLVSRDRLPRPDQATSSACVATPFDKNQDFEFIHNAGDIYGEQISNVKYSLHSFTDLLLIQIHRKRARIRISPATRLRIGHHAWISCHCHPFKCLARTLLLYDV
jgi:hypothetical protein